MDVVNKFLELSGLRKDEIEIKVIGMRPGEKIEDKGRVMVREGRDNAYIPSQIIFYKE